MEKNVKVFRLILYTGTREWIDRTLNISIKEGRPYMDREGNKISILTTKKG